MSKINATYALNASGVLDIEDGKIRLMVEDRSQPIVIADLLKDLDGKVVDLSVCSVSEL